MLEICVAGMSLPHLPPMRDLSIRKAIDREVGRSRGWDRQRESRWRGSGAEEAGDDESLQHGHDDADEKVMISVPVMGYSDIFSGSKRFQMSKEWRNRKQTWSVSSLAMSSPAIPTSAMSKDWYPPSHTWQTSRLNSSNVDEGKPLPSWSRKSTPESEYSRSGLRASLRASTKVRTSSRQDRHGIPLWMQKDVEAMLCEHRETLRKCSRSQSLRPRLISRAGVISNLLMETQLALMKDENVSARNLSEKAEEIAQKSATSSVMRIVEPKLPHALLLKEDDDDDDEHLKVLKYMRRRKPLALKKIRRRQRKGTKIPPGTLSVYDFSGLSTLRHSSASALSSGKSSITATGGNRSRNSIPQPWLHDNQYVTGLFTSAQKISRLHGDASHASQSMRQNDEHSFDRGKVTEVNEELAVGHAHPETTNNTTSTSSPRHLMVTIPSPAQNMIQNICPETSMVESAPVAQPTRARGIVLNGDRNSVNSTSRQEIVANQREISSDGSIAAREKTNVSHEQNIAPRRITNINRTMEDANTPMQSVKDVKTSRSYVRQHSDGFKTKITLIRADAPQAAPTSLETVGKESNASNNMSSDKPMVVETKNDSKVEEVVNSSSEARAENTSQLSSSISHRESSRQLEDETMWTPKRASPAGDKKITDATKSAGVESFDALARRSTAMGTLHSTAEAFLETLTQTMRKNLSSNDFFNVFSACDESGSQMLSWDEIHHGLERLGFHCSTEIISSAMRQLHFLPGKKLKFTEFLDRIRHHKLTAATNKASSGRVGGLNRVIEQRKTFSTQALSPVDGTIALPSEENSLTSNVEDIVGREPASIHRAEQLSRDKLTGQRAMERAERHAMQAEEWYQERLKWWDHRDDGSWEVVRVFVSSTFKDFLGERDVLQKYVFPELNLLLRSRRVRVVPVDLRWGLTAEDTSESGLGAIEYCLREVDRSRPVFVLLEGERYGWVPPSYRVSDRPEFAWVKDFPKGRAITEMEAIHGFLRKPFTPVHALCYARDPSFIAKIKNREEREVFQFDSDGHDASVNKPKRDNFRRLVREHPYCKFRTYKCDYKGRDKSGKIAVTGLSKGVGSFQRLILADLFEAMAAEFKVVDPEVELDTQHRLAQKPLTFNHKVLQSLEKMGQRLRRIAKTMTELERERAPHKRFAQFRIANFVQRESTLQKLRSRLQLHKKSGDEQNRTVVLLGEPGSGKTSIMCHLSDFAATRNDVAITHIVGATSRSLDIRRTLMRLAIEAQHEAEAGIFPAQVIRQMDFAKLKDAFLDVLENASLRLASRNSHMIIIIDGIEQLGVAHGAHLLDWVPLYTPARVSLFLSCTLPNENPSGTSGTAIAQIMKTYHQCLSSRDPELDTVLVDSLSYLCVK